MDAEISLSGSGNFLLSDYHVGALPFHAAIHAPHEIFEGAG
jgi:hypothetical protein